MRQSKPDSGLGFQLEDLKRLQSVPSSLGRGRGGTCGACVARNFPDRIQYLYGLHGGLVLKGLIGVSGVGFLASKFRV